jgi:hypothetical protein
VLRWALKLPVAPTPLGAYTESVSNLDPEVASLVVVVGLCHPPDGETDLSCRRDGFILRTPCAAVVFLDRWRVLQNRIKDAFQPDFATPTTGISR